MKLIELPIVFFKYEDKEDTDEFNASYEDVKRELGIEDDTEPYKEEVLIKSYVDIDFFKYPIITKYLDSDGELSDRYTTIFYGDHDLRLQIKVKMGVQEVVNIFKENYSVI